MYKTQTPTPTGTTAPLKTICGGGKAAAAQCLGARTHATSAATCMCLSSTWTQEKHQKLPAGSGDSYVCQLGSSSFTRPGGPQVAEQLLLCGGFLCRHSNGSSSPPGLTYHPLEPQRHPTFVDMMWAPLAQWRMHSCSSTFLSLMHDLNDLQDWQTNLLQSSPGSWSGWSRATSKCMTSLTLQKNCFGQLSGCYHDLYRAQQSCGQEMTEDHCNGCLRSMCCAWYCLSVPVKAQVTAADSSKPL